MQSRDALQPSQRDAKSIVARDTWVIDGRAIARAVRREVAADVARLVAAGITPGLSVTLVGDDPASQIYVRGKIRDCEEVGIRSTVTRMPADTPARVLLDHIDALNRDDGVDGVLVQLPLPAHIPTLDVVSRVRSDKDVDGFGAPNLGCLVSGEPGLVACTPGGVMRMLAEVDRAMGGFPLAGRDAVVIGRSRIVGTPMALLLLDADASVTVCHHLSRDLRHHVERAELLVVATGARHLIHGSWLKSGAVVIDVGITRNADGSLSGDVDFASALGIAAAISPVPGGVGPMTRAMLLRNTVDACARRRGEAAGLRSAPLTFRATRP